MKLFITCCSYLPFFSLCYMKPKTKILRFRSSGRARLGASALPSIAENIGVHEKYEGKANIQGTSMHSHIHPHAPIHATAHAQWLKLRQTETKPVNLTYECTTWPSFFVFLFLLFEWTCFIRSVNRPVIITIFWFCCKNFHQANMEEDCADKSSR